MKPLNEDIIETIDLDLNAIKSGEIKEFSYLRSMGKQIEIILRMMFGSSGLRGLLGGSGHVRGTREQIKSFAQALGKEKRYMKSFTKYGLDDPRTMRTRHSLEKAIAGFEKETGIKWPVK
jgi:hypothetical protein